MIPQTRNAFHINRRAGAMTIGKSQSVQLLTAIRMLCIFWDRNVAYLLNLKHKRAVNLRKEQENPRVVRLLSNMQNFKT